MPSQSSKTLDKTEVIRKETVNTQTPEETAALAGRFAQQLKPGDVVAFFGDLGTGKTFFIQGICRALGCREYVTSPTFTILQEYQTPSGIPIYHFDFYRLSHPAELVNLGLEDFLYGEGISVIEWADKIQDELPIPRWEIHLSFVEGQATARQIRILRVEWKDDQNA
ncbi:MAG: tRNA (adenosine(37)-N6)-threonylcarbamoyltransferase complex ATPase subunit type 1 TsaE [Calditrichaeota bacterium]|nr:tRNA (adenosine(37)-N6)-threonylcarbamoyltransferase complex ATPase subunit type 1 TsaE [Calditrichota bacterium]